MIGVLSQIRLSKAAGDHLPFNLYQQVHDIACKISKDSEDLERLPIYIGATQEDLVAQARAHLTVHIPPEALHYVEVDITAKANPHATWLGLLMEGPVVTFLLSDAKP